MKHLLIYLENFAPKIQILGYSYNKYLIFASSFLKDDNHLIDTDKNYLTLFMIFLFFKLIPM